MIGDSHPSRGRDHTSDHLAAAEVSTPACRCGPAPADGAPIKYLARDHGNGPTNERYRFTTHLEIGRDEAERTATAGLLLVCDPSVSFRHCLITQTAEGACFVRDVSRNGTLLDGRRLLPNAEAEFRIGQTLALGHGIRFVLEGQPATPRVSAGRTKLEPNLTLATVLVGDIHDYTVMVRKAPPTALQRSVSRVFEILTSSVEELGGTVKEFPGDAILAFWEGNFRGHMALSATHAAIALDQLVRRLAADRSVWSLEDFPLRMDWALASGQVIIEAFGGATPVGLSMIGEPVVLACRIEKLATETTGPILACRVTREMVGRAVRELQPHDRESHSTPALEFTDLGEIQAKGFDKPDHVFSLRVPG